MCRVFSLCNAELPARSSRGEFVHLLFRSQREAPRQIMTRNGEPSGSGGLPSLNFKVDGRVLSLRSGDFYRGNHLLSCDRRRRLEVSEAVDGRVPRLKPKLDFSDHKLHTDDQTDKGLKIRGENLKTYIVQCTTVKCKMGYSSDPAL